MYSTLTGVIHVLYVLAQYMYIHVLNYTQFVLYLQDLVSVNCLSQKLFNSIPSPFLFPMISSCVMYLSYPYCTSLSLSLSLSLYYSSLAGLNCLHIAAQFGFTSIVAFLVTHPRFAIVSELWSLSCAYQFSS